MTIDAEFGDNASVVLYVLGGSGGGLALVYEYNLMIIERYIARSANKLPAGKHRIEATTRLDSARPSPQVVRTTVKRNVPAALSSSETFDVGVDLGSSLPLDHFERRPFRFDDKIDAVQVRLNRRPAGPGHALRAWLSAARAGQSQDGDRPGRQ